MSRKCLSLVSALTLVFTSCGGADDQQVEGPIASSGPLECEVLDFPCTWNEVPREVVERTDALGEIAGLYGLSGVPLDSIAEFLREQPDVAAVEVLGTGVRYRLEGGGPAWVYPADELAHHHPPEGFSSAGDRVGATETPPRGVPGPEAHPRGSYSALARRLPGTPSESGALPGLGRWLGPEPLLAAVPNSAGEQGIAVKTAGDPKKALILSPFEWQFPGTGAGYARRVWLIRDYREERGGSVVYHADLDVYEDNAAEPGEDQRLYDGTLLLSGEVTFEDFLHWDDYNLVLSASHGTEHHCELKPPVGGARGPANPEGPRVAKEWCPLIWAGRAKRESYGSYRGVEVITQVGTLYEDHPGLTRLEAEDCARRLAEREAAREAGQEVVSEELKTPGGKPCRVEAEREKRLVGLWTPFFQDQYRNGLNNIILFLAACRSAINDVLLKHFAQDGNERVAVFGFNNTVTGADAFDVGNELLGLLLDEGHHSTEIIRRLKLMDRTKHLVGRALDLGDEALPATPAEVIDQSAAPTHGRDVVLLVNPTTGVEIEDGAVLRLRGAPGDAKTDSLELYPQIIGVADSDPLDEIRLRVRVVGRTRPGATYEPREEVEPGVYRHRGPVALGFDAKEGEIVDLEVSGTLPGDGETRWVYKDIRLGGCYWKARMSGTYDRELSGNAVTFGPLPGAEAHSLHSLVLDQLPGTPAQQAVGVPIFAVTDGLFFFLPGPLEARPFGMGRHHGDGQARIFTPEVPMGVSSRGQLVITAYRPDEIMVGGFAMAFDGVIFADPGTADQTIQGEFVWTPACPTGRDLFLGRAPEAYDRVRELMEEGRIPWLP